MFTVQDVLNLPIMKQASLVTEAKSQLQNPVEWVSIIEMPVENFVRKNEFVLSSGIGCEQDANKLLTFTKEIMEAKAAALVIATGRYITSLPKKVVHFCEEHGFPLIELPWEVRFTDVSHAVSTALHQKEQGFVQYSDKVRKEMLEIVLKGQGVAKIAAYLEQSLHMPVVVTDRRGTVKCTSNHAKALEEQWNAHLLHHGDPLYFQHEENADTVASPSNMHWIHTEAVTMLQLSIQTAREIQGYLLIGWPEGISEDDVFSERITVLLEHAVTSSALCFLHDQAVLETEMRLKDDFVWSLAKGKFDSYDTALSRAKSLHYNLHVPYLCLIAKPESLSTLYEQDPYNSMSFENWVKQLGDMLEEEVYHTGRTMHRKTMSTFQKEELIIYVELLTEKSIEAAYPFIELLQYRLNQKWPRLTVSWGIAKTTGIDAFHAGYQEAYSALDIGRRQKGKGYISTYADTRFDRALLALAENEELRKITDIIIAPLHKYSRERNIDLVHTFSVYNRHRGNVSQTARELNLHRQSLLYRLRKIETLTGCKLENSDDTFLIDLSVRLHTIRGSTAAPPVIQ
ncbi:purine catabolism regulatory protein [Alteribacillus persepolensis]|uniref:Purine catabolism regulatory protein n=1 Tax=Alteribacillus persepolensis TaxID=568899 RepID=A0A1G7ZA31_9BACI|nr:PucR family transcriptional regulator [Alteribacillus persepolensis]SDH05465.1 purine catabolism regulatory protein [Alteribacillus persepolensis]